MLLHTRSRCAPRLSMPAHHAGASGVSGTAGQAPADPLVARVKQQTAEVHAAAVDAVDRAIARGGALDAVGAKVCVRCVRCAASPEVALLPLRAQSVVRHRMSHAHTRVPVCVRTNLLRVTVDGVLTRACCAPSGPQAEALRDDSDSFRNKGRGPKGSGGYAGKKAKTPWRRFKSTCTRTRKAVVSGVKGAFGSGEKDGEAKGQQQRGERTTKVLGVETVDHSAPPASQ